MAASLPRESLQDGGQLSAWASRLVAAGACAPSADNSQPWRFTIDERSLKLGVDVTRAEQGLGADHPTVSLALGAAAENVAQAALAEGFPASALQFSDGGPDSELLRVAAPDPLVRTKPPERLPLADRHTNRTEFSRERLPAELIASVAATSVDHARVIVLQESEEIAALAGLLRMASEARFRDEEIHRWLSASLRFSQEDVARGDGLDVRTLALPPGGALMMRLIADWRRMSRLNLLGAYKLLAAIEAASFKACGAIVVVLADGWGRRELLPAGRLMERIWIRLNSSGIAVHPYYVLSDQLYRCEAGKTPAVLRSEVGDLTEKAKAALGLEGQVPAMLLRIGQAKMEVPRSVRLPTQRLVAGSRD